MTVILQFRLSGGAGNTDPNASLGGAMSNTAMSGTALNNLFDDVGASEASAGRTEYRLVYVRNGGTAIAQLLRLWLSSNTPSATTTIDIGLATEGVGGTPVAIANETTAPAGVTFSAPSSAGAGLFNGSLAASGWVPMWVRRSINAGTAAVNSDPFEMRGDYEFVPA